MTQDSFNILFGMIMVVLQLGIINTVRADIRKDTLKIYKDLLQYTPMLPYRIQSR
jgi:hypothetical protein